MNVHETRACKYSTCCLAFTNMFIHSVVLYFFHVDKIIFLAPSVTTVDCSLNAKKAQIYKYSYKKHHRKTAYRLQPQTNWISICIRMVWLAKCKVTAWFSSVLSLRCKWQNTVDVIVNVLFTTNSCGKGNIYMVICTDTWKLSVWTTRQLMMLVKTLCTLHMVISQHSNIKYHIVELCTWGWF